MCSSDNPVITNTLEECLSSCDVKFTCMAVSFSNIHCTPHTCLSTIAGENGGNYYIKKCPGINVISIMICYVRERVMGV